MFFSFPFLSTAQCEFQYFTPKCGVLTSLQVEITTLSGGVSVFISYSDPNPGPFSFDLQDTSSQAVKSFVINRADTSIPLYIAVLGMLLLLFLLFCVCVFCVCVFFVVVVFVVLCVCVFWFWFCCCVCVFFGFGFVVVLCVCFLVLVLLFFVCVFWFWFWFCFSCFVFPFFVLFVFLVFFSGGFF